MGKSKYQEEEEEAQKMFFRVVQNNSWALHLCACSGIPIHIRYLQLVNHNRPCHRWMRFLTTLDTVSKFTEYNHKCSLLGSQSHYTSSIAWFSVVSSKAKYSWRPVLCSQLMRKILLCIKSKFTIANTDITTIKSKGRHTNRRVCMCMSMRYKTMFTLEASGGGRLCKDI